MVCHETYKDQNNKWLSPEEVSSEDGKKFFKKDSPSEQVVVGPTESMSKSKKNTIDPEKIIENFGADSVRLFILSDSPPEKDVQWSENGMSSAFKYVQKFWLMNEKIASILKKEKLEQRKAQIQQEIKENERLLQSVKKKEKSAVSVMAIQEKKIALKENLIKTTEKQAKLLSNDMYINQVEINRLKKELKVLLPGLKLLHRKLTLTG